jgi:hypothetical protein
LIGRLEHFVKAAEDLMRLVMIVNNECNKELEKLENQNQVNYIPLLCKFMMIPIFFYFKFFKFHLLI